MTQSSLSRQQRRKLERDLVKPQVNSPKTTQPNPAENEYVTKKDLQLLVQDVQKVLNYAKLVDNHVWMLVETLDRKGILNWSDVNETENLYTLRDKNKQEEVKRILSLDLSIPEILEVIKESPDKHGYEKFDINPVRDLNVNPYELGAYLRELNPDLSQEGLLSLGKKWGMTLDYFGFKPKQD